MENADTTRTHPLVLAAAASVLVVSAAGTAALMGWLPATRAPHAAEPVATVVAPPVVAPAPEAAPLPETRPVAESKPAQQPKPVAREAPAPAKVAEAPKRVDEPVRVADEPPAPSRVAEPPPVAAAPAVCTDCGVVASVRTIETPGDGSGVGAVAGGVAGGAVGSQFGKGKGQIVGAVLGAVGGAIAGHQVERHVVRKHTQYEVTVKLDDGTTRTIVQDAEPAWRPGDHVRVNGNEIRSAV